MNNSKDLRWRAARLALVASICWWISGCATNDIEKARRALALHDQADSMYQTKNCQVAVDIYQQLVVQFPRDPESWFRLGNCHSRLGYPELALDAYRQSLSLKPGSGKAWHNMISVQAQALAKSYSEMRGNVAEDDPVLLKTTRLLRRLAEVTAMVEGIDRQPVNPSSTDQSAVQHVGVNHANDE